MKKWLSAIILLTAAAILAACGGKADSSESAKHVKIGATSGPFSDMVSKAIKPGLEKKGYTVEVVEFSDYVQPNIALSKGDIQANLFQHKNYMENFAKENKIQLSEVISVPTAPMGIYSNTYKSLNDVKPGSSFTLPSDPVNGARAFIILQKEGLIKLNPGVSPLKVSEKDIADNPFKLQFKPLEAGQLPRSVDSADMAAVPGNFAVASGMDLHSAIAVEDMADDYRNRVVVDSKNINAQFAKDMKKVVESPEFERVIDKDFAGFGKPEWMKSE